jgi:hypothetical protein
MSSNDKTAEPPVCRAPDPNAKKLRSRFPRVLPGDLVDLITTCIPDEAARRRILVDNPQRLYGFT